MGMISSHDTAPDVDQERIDLGHKLTIPTYIFPDVTHKRIYNVPCGDWSNNTEFFELVERTDTDLKVIYCGQMYSVMESDFISAERLNDAISVEARSFLGDLLFVEAHYRPVTMQADQWEQFAKYLLHVVLQ
jgi:hypothetical protein